MAEKSGASVSISDSTSKEYGTVWKYVQLRGTGRAVDRAKKLLHIRLERLEPRIRPSSDGDGDGELEEGDFEYGEGKAIGEEFTEGDGFENPSYHHQRVGYGRGRGQVARSGGGGMFGRSSRGQHQGSRGGGGGGGRNQGRYEGFSNHDVTQSFVGGSGSMSHIHQHTEGSGDGYEQQLSLSQPQKSTISKRES